MSAGAEAGGPPAGEAAHDNRYSIHADSVIADRRTLVLKEGDSFGVFGPGMDIESLAEHAHGLYRDDTRFLSRLELRIEGRRPLLLAAAITRDNARIAADYTNPDLIGAAGQEDMPRGTLHISRSRFIWAGVMYERLVVTNFGFRDVEATLSIGFAADFVDVFEIRGTSRDRRGTDLEPEVLADTVTLGYEGLDGIVRRTVLRLNPVPDELARSGAAYRLRLGPRARTAIEFSVSCDIGRPLPVVTRSVAIKQLRRHIRAFHERQCRIDSGGSPLSYWTRRSLADIRQLLIGTPSGPYPCAGVPWYAAPFGRDGIITALSLLWVDASIARGVLMYLGATQADSHDPARDAEPGKILHERRVDEMANTGEVPFGRYYGSVDATPLFIVLAGAYHSVTGDKQTTAALWPHVARALAWIDQYGDIDGDGFVEYRSKAESGLINQGWKDSADSIFHADGTLAEGPIALCEVQGYVYQARRAAARLARALGMPAEAERQELRAEDLRRRFERAFWLPELGTYALALDGEKRPCAVRASNAGHCLFSGIAAPERAASVARLLMSRTMFSGWGIRTVATTEVRYDPMSYHNGSVWPHDNGIIAAGMARYRARSAVSALLNSFLDAANYVELRRLPELFCGFRRHHGRGPTPYPVACSPQAWSAATAFMLLHAALGLRVDGAARRVTIRRPLLPRSIPRLAIHGLRVGDSSVDLLFERDYGDVGVVVLGKQGPVTVIVQK